MNITEFNVKDIVTRNERAQCENYTDGSYMGDKVKIVKLTDEYAEVEFLDDNLLKGDTHSFTGPWLEGWTRIHKAGEYLTKDDFYKLAGLLHQAQEYDEEINKLRKSMYKLLDQDPEDFGSFVDDAIWERYSVDELLEKEGIGVEDE